MLLGPKVISRFIYSVRQWTIFDLCSLSLVSVSLLDCRMYDFGQFWHGIWYIAFLSVSILSSGGESNFFKVMSEWTVHLIVRLDKDRRIFNTCTSDVSQIYGKFRLFLFKFGFLYRISYIFREFLYGITFYSLASMTLVILSRSVLRSCESLVMDFALLKRKNITLSLILFRWCDCAFK